MNIKDQLVKVGLRHTQTNTGTQSAELLPVAPWAGEDYTGKSGNRLFFPNIEAAKASTLLLASASGATAAGCFLVRSAEKRLTQDGDGDPDQYILSVVHKDGTRVAHHELTRSTERRVFQLKVGDGEHLLADDGQRDQSLASAIHKLQVKVSELQLPFHLKSPVRPGDWGSIDNAIGLSQRLCSLSVTRRSGVHETEPVLISAEAGSGKTWMCKQILATVSSDDAAAGLTASNRYVPLLVVIQRLSTLMRSVHRNPAEHILEWYLNAELEAKRLDEGGNPIFDADRVAMLWDAFRSRRMLLILDGIDEAADLRVELQHFIQQSLLPHQHRFITTSRPEGLTESLTSAHGLVVLDLKRLTEEQQRIVVEKQLEGDMSEFMVSVRLGPCLQRAPGLRIRCESALLTLVATAASPSSTGKCLQVLGCPAQPGRGLQRLRV